MNENDEDDFDDITSDDARRSKKKRRRSRELELLTIRNFMKTENGRSFMWRCLEDCSTFIGTFSSDPIQSAFNSGSRKHGLWLVMELKEAAPDEYVMMIKEHINE